MEWKKIFSWDWRENYKFRIASGLFGLAVITCLIVNDFSQNPGIRLKPSEIFDTRDSISGILVEVEKYNAMAKIKLNDSSYRFTPFARNVANNPADIERFLKKGDRLVKERNNDTIRVFRSDSVYYFVSRVTIKKSSERAIHKRGDDE